MDIDEQTLRQIVREEVGNKAPLHRAIPTSSPQSEADQLAASTAPPADASAYNLAWHSRAHDIDDPAAFQALDTSLRNFAKDVGLPAHVGGSVLAQAIDDIRKWERMTPGDRDDYTRSQRQLLGRLLPGVSAEDIEAGAETVLKRANPEFVKDARANGMFASAGLMAQLYTQSLRDALRSAR
jgi:hypothetical protein